MKLKMDKETIRESLLYIIVGVSTTLVNFAVYFLVTRVFGINELASTCISWVIAVLYAYFADKIIVFHKMDFQAATIVKEMSSFYSMRLLSLALELGIIALFHTWLGINDLIVKAGAQVLVIISNFIFSKFFIFKKNETHKTSE